jgi:hypothetical protein
MLLEINFSVGRELGNPLIKILIDDYLVLYEGVAMDTFFRDFDVSDGEHELKIVHYGKSDKDHLYNSDGSIRVDKFVYINSITIDGIKLTDIELQQGKFWPVYSLQYAKTMTEQHKELPGFIQPNLYLGHNGTWKYKFFNPFTTWIITKRNYGPNLEDTIFKTSNELLEEAKCWFNSVDEF